MKAIRKTIEQFYGKNPQLSPDYGRVINERQFKRLKRLIEAEKEYITFGGSTDESDLYIEPTILENVTWSNPIMEDEIFGPILPVMKYDSLKMAIYEIQKLPKPLAAYFFSEHEKAISYFLQELPFGEDVLMIPLPM